jgi:hypothetical protein
MYSPGQPRVRSSSPGTGKIFVLPTSSRPVLESTQPPIQWSMETLSPGIKWPGREVEILSRTLFRNEPLGTRFGPCP